MDQLVSAHKVQNNKTAQCNMMTVEACRQVIGNALRLIQELEVRNIVGDYPVINEFGDLNQIAKSGDDLESHLQ